MIATLAETDSEAQPLEEGDRPLAPRVYMRYDIGVRAMVQGRLCIGRPVGAFGR